MMGGDEVIFSAALVIAGMAAFLYVVYVKYFTWNQKAALLNLTVLAIIAYFTGIYRVSRFAGGATGLIALAVTAVFTGYMARVLDHKAVMKAAALAYAAATDKETSYEQTGSRKN